jgi:hypothetical protein
VLELVLGQRADELPGFALDRLVREGEADAEGEQVKSGMAVSGADVPPDRLDSAHRRGRVNPP